ncbi:MAG: VCBS repeat-containing protein [Isosphaeraceae bacterium]|nr:VCBS repeat-containing protein [Isosphaeraceae bacterium]
MRTAPLLCLLLALPAAAADFPRFEAQEIDPHVGNVCYALTTADVDGDNKLDIIAVTEDSVVWFANPDWKKQIVIQKATARDNVCLQAHDIDGDGRIDFALGAGWQPTNTKSGGTLQWLGRDKDGRWQVHPIGSEPTLHRIRWGDVLGNGRKQLVVAPLQGRGTKGPNWGEGQGVRILVYRIPEHPAQDEWPSEVADEDLHTVHNLQIIDADGDGRNDILLAAWEGVFLLRRGSDGKWAKTKLGAGNQEAKPFKGASEIKLGRLADGRRYLATIEPWHGFQVVVYTPPKTGDGLWDRHVIDEPVQWGHAVWCSDLDGDGDEELIIGQRDPGKAPSSLGTRGPGVFVYDPKGGSSGGLEFTKHVIDDGGVATEDALAADLDGDGRPEIIAGGRATHNVKIYWNRGK